MANVKTQLIIEGKNNSKKAFDEVNQQLDRMNKKLATAGKAIVAAFSVNQIVSAVRAVSAVSDAYNLMMARLKLATDSQEEFNTAQNELRRIASATQAPIESLVTLYGRISRPLKEAGRSQQEILQVTEAVATSFRVSGASAQEAENGVIQFAQALGAGALRGDEFNSVAEQAPRLMQALATALGVPIGALKEMAKQGELTADVVTDALVSQLDQLRLEAESLPQTVGGAMTELGDKINEAIGKADLSELVKGIEELGNTLTDPAVIKGLADLVTGMAQLAGWAAIAASEFSTFAKELAHSAAEANGYVDELGKLEKTLKEVQAAQSGSSFLGSNTVAILTKWLAPERLDEWVKELEQKIAETRAKIDGISVESQKKLDAAASAEVDAAKELADQEQAALNQKTKQYREHVAEMNKIRLQQVSDAKNGGKALIAAEKSANAELKKIKSERLKIEQEFSDSIARTRAGVGGEATFGGAMDLKLGAKQALGAKDGEAAIRQAREALKVLEELEQSGANTYGFVGIKEELQAIALAGNQLQQEQVQAELDGVKKKIEDVEAAAAKLKDLPVSVKADEASMEKARTDIQRLAEMLGNTEIVLPVRIQHPDGPIIQDLPDLPKFAKGTKNAPPGMAWVGEQGPELVVFGGGEQVLTAAASQNLMQTMSGMNLSSFGGAGLSEAAAAVQPSGPGRDLGRVELALPGGEKLSLLADGENFDRIVRRTAMKRGRTRVN